MSQVDKCSQIMDDVIAFIKAEDLKGLAKYMDAMTEDMHPSEIYSPIVMSNGYATHPDLRESRERLRQISAKQLGKEYKPISDDYKAGGFVFRPDGFVIE